MVRVCILAGDIILFVSLGKTVPLAIQVYKWVPSNLMLGGGGGGEVTMLFQGQGRGSRNTLSCFMLQKPG